MYSVQLSDWGEIPKKMFQIKVVFNKDYGHCFLVG